MTNFNLTFTENDLSLHHHVKSKIPFFSNDLKTSVTGLAHIYSDGGDLIKYLLIDEYVKNQALPMMVISDYGYLFKQMKKNNPELLAESVFVDIVLNDTNMELNTSLSQEEINQKTIEACQKNQISEFNSELHLLKLNETYNTQFKEYFFQHLAGMENILSQIPKTIVFVSVQEETFTAEEFERINTFMEKAKEYHHIIILSVFTYGYMLKEKTRLLGSGNLYDHLSISTEGYSNKQLCEFKDSQLYHYLPQNIQHFFNSPELKKQVEHRNFYNKKYEVTVLNSYSGDLNIFE